MNKTIGAPEPVRELKHSIIIASVETLRQTRLQVQNLLDEITGVTLEKEENVDYPNTLRFVLNNVSGEISSECEKISNLLVNIREELF